MGNTPVFIIVANHEGPRDEGPVAIQTGGAWELPGNLSKAECQRASPRFIPQLHADLEYQLSDIC